MEVEIPTDVPQLGDMHATEYLFVRDFLVTGHLAHLLRVYEVLYVLSRQTWQSYLFTGRIRRVLASTS